MAGGLRDAVIVGAGHNGLVCAAVLARAGLDVLVLERRDVAGGALEHCAYAIHLLRPEVVEAAGLELPPFRDPPPRRGYLPDGSELEATDAAWDAWWEDAARAVDPFGAPAPLRGPSLAELLGTFFDDPRARTWHAPPFFDGDPHAAGSARAYAWYETSRLPEAIGGVCDTTVLAAAFARGAQRAGAEVRLGAEVVGLADGAVELAGGTRIEARTVVSGLDPWRTRRLAGLEPGPRPAPGSAKARLRLDAELRELALVYRELDWHRAPQRPYVELQPRDEPGEASAYVPWVDGTARAELEAQVREAVARALPGASVLELDLRLPDDLERELGLTGGQIHHLPCDRVLPGPRTELPWLSLCGAGTWPGGEVSGVPGLNAARAILAAQ